MLYSSALLDGSSSTGKDKDSLNLRNLLNILLTVCQAGWSEFEEKCYKYFSERKTWNEAEEECEREEVRKL